MPSLLKIASTISDNQIKTKLERIAIDLIATRAGIDPEILKQLQQGYQEMVSLASSKKEFDGSQYPKWTKLIARLVNMPSDTLKGLHEAMIQIGKNDLSWRKPSTYQALSILATKCANWAKVDPSLWARFQSLSTFTKIIQDISLLKKAVENVQTRENPPGRKI